MTDEKKKELIPLLQAKLGTGFKALSIDECNHKPHRFMIGPKHISYASDHYSGMLGNETLKKVPCAHPRCQSSYEEHTHDTVLCVRLTRNLTNAVALASLKKASKLIEENSLSGVVFVQTKEKFKIAPPKEKTDD